MYVSSVKKLFSFSRAWKTQVFHVILLHYKLNMSLMNTFITKPTGYLPEGVSGNVSRRWSRSMSCPPPPHLLINNKTYLQSRLLTGLYLLPDESARKGSVMPVTPCKLSPATVGTTFAACSKGEKFFALTVIIKIKSIWNQTPKN
jgi:hypothetical protein